MAIEGVPKFIKDSNGVRRLNPQWAALQKSQQAAARGPQMPTSPQMPNAATALPVVSTMQDMAQQLPGSKPADSVTATVEVLQDEQIAADMGAPSNLVMANLQRIFSRWETPIGLINKLMILSEMNVMEFIVDDSGSMNQGTDSKDIHGRVMSRWAEVHARLKGMFEIIAYVPSPNKIFVRFLNLPHVLDLSHQSGEPPERYLARVHSVLDNVFKIMPQGTTPARERIAESLQRYPQGMTVARYFFGDGQPNGGGMAAHAITQMLIHRPNPQQNPFTFLSCTDDDSAVEWMKECEEAAPFCAELDDYHTECNEVLHDQGQAFPFTYGMYLIAQLVAASNPDDLDALDESAPFSAATMSNMMGYQIDAPSYKHYFDHFLAAQNAQRVETQLDQLKKAYVQQWPQFFNQFLSVPGPARMLPVVQQYHAQVLDLKRRGM